MIYLASPYSAPANWLREMRFHDVCRYAAKMMREGLHVFSPIAHSHPLAAYGLTGAWAFWEAQDREFLSMCSELWVLMLPGWEASTGVTAEIAIANELGLPIRYVNAE